MVAPYAIIVRCFHPEQVVAGWNIGVGGPSVAAGIVPLLVEAFQYKPVTVLAGSKKTESCKFKAERVIVVCQLKGGVLLPILGEIRFKPGRPVEQLKAGNLNGWVVFIFPQLMGIESVESIGRAYIHAS